MSQVQRKGPWIEERMLGSGGFGAVMLWKNDETGDKLALKKCRLANEMTEKHKQRWKLEVQIMQRLDHENVIAAREVPPEIDVNASDLPLLAMEYCSKGDLRRVLTLPQNCCGLREYSVRCLVHDVAAGIEYLHGKKIIHRDLKPENIVLKEIDEKNVVYKIIDLGYAKELDQGSVCTSFVGTLQYLAPELFASQKYTCTVDYWSFGTVVFECITGYRPFLPSYPPVQWHKEVCKKSPDDICARIEEHGEVKFSKTIPTTNRLSRSMQTYMEQWLRMLLRWDPKNRGGNLALDGRPTCFSMLDSILKMKIIYLLNVASNELLTYPILDQHSMLDLQKRIEEETKIGRLEQDIVLANGMTPDPEKPAAQCWLEPAEENCFVFLFRQGGGDFTTENAVKKNKSLPAAVQTIVKDPNTMLPVAEQKKAWAESVFFCEEHYLEFKRLGLSQRAAMLSLLRIDSIFVKLKNKMLNELDLLMATIKFFQESYEQDVFLYGQQVSSGGVSSVKMFERWTKMAEEVENFKDMKQQVNELEQQAVVLQTKIVELQRSPFAKTKQDNTLEELSKQAIKTYQEFRQNSRENKDVIRDQKPMVTIVVKCVMWRDKKMPDLFAHLGKIGACKADINVLKPEVENCLNAILRNSQKLIEYQKQRQADIWKLMKAALQSKVGDEVPVPVSDMVDQSNNLCHPDLSSSGRSTASGIPSIMQSLLMTSNALESLHAVEDGKISYKMFDDAINTCLQEYDEFCCKLSSLSSESMENS